MTSKQDDPDTQKEQRIDKPPDTLDRKTDEHSDTSEPVYKNIHMDGLYRLMKDGGYKHTTDHDYDETNARTGPAVTRPQDDCDTSDATDVKKADQLCGDETPRDTDDNDPSCCKKADNMTTDMQEKDNAWIKPLSSDNGCDAVLHIPQIDITDEQAIQIRMNRQGALERRIQKRERQIEDGNCTHDEYARQACIRRRREDLARPSRNLWMHKSQVLRSHGTSAAQGGTKFAKRIKIISITQVIDCKGNLIKHDNSSSDVVKAASNDQSKSFSGDGSSVVKAATSDKRATEDGTISNVSGKDIEGGEYDTNTSTSGQTHAMASRVIQLPHNTVPTVGCQSDITTSETSNTTNGPNTQMGVLKPRPIAAARSLQECKLGKMQTGNLIATECERDIIGNGSCAVQAANKQDNGTLFTNDSSESKDAINDAVTPFFESNRTIAEQTEWRRMPKDVTKFVKEKQSKVKRRKSAM